MRKIALIILYLGLYFKGFSQSFGGFPPSFKWYKIENATTTVIFPKGLENQATRIANYLEYLDENHRQSIGDKRRSVDVILQNNFIQPNGFVTLAPFRSEFFVSPSQNSFMLGSLPWLDLLAIHEYRHVMQFTNGLRGASKICYYLFGQFGWAFATGLAVPDWFWEGDAVVTETALSNQGRGRLPAFFNPFRSLGLTGTVYKYMKVRNGSFKDYIPSHYELGYQMCVYGRETYGNEFWRNVFKNAVQYRSVFYPFSRAIKRNTGGIHNSSSLYKSMINFYHEKWRQEMDTLYISPADKVKHLPKKNTFTSYKFPYYIDEENIITLKSSFKEIDAFVIINKYGGEKRIKSQSFAIDEYFHYRNGKVTWAEYVTHPRWYNYEYSVIKVLDINTGNESQISHKSRYFSPSFSPDASEIVVFEQTSELKFSLHILDANTGNLKKSLPNPENYYFTYPKFSADGRYIISSARNTKGEMALLKQDIESGEFSVLVDFSNNVLGISYPTDQSVYFEASFSGIDNIYKVNFGEDKVYQITSRPLGNYQPLISNDGSKLIFSEFSKMGNELFATNLDTIKPKEFNIINVLKQKKFETIATKEEGEDVSEKVDSITTQYEVTKYKQAANWINIHSWRFLPFHPVYTLGLVSDNVLSNVSLEAYAYLNVNDNNAGYEAFGLYGGLFPFIKLGAYGETERRQVLSDLYTSENGGTVGAIVPLQWYSGRFIKRISLFSDFSIASTRFRSSFSENYVVNKYNFSGIEFLNYRKKATQNIYTHFGQYVSANQSSLLSSNAASQQHVVYELAFPGVFPNHNFVAEGGYINQQNMLEYRFANEFYYSRGYMPISLFTKEAYRVGLNYHFPIAYPDWGFAGLLYFKRIRGNVFYDISDVKYIKEVNIDAGGNARIDYSTLPMNSWGAEIIFDNVIFNILPATLGIRISSTLNPNLERIGSFEVFFPIKRL